MKKSRILQNRFDVEEYDDGFLISLKREELDEQVQCDKAMKTLWQAKIEFSKIQY